MTRYAHATSVQADVATNDTTPRYDAAAAQLAWKRTLALFNRSLRAAPPR